MTKIPGLFESTFWDTVVLQASQSEPAVLHASLALSAAHRNFRPGYLVTRRSTIDGDESFILQHYNRAIAHARELLADSSRSSTRVGLILCLLFTCMEYMRGHYGVGNAHLSGGLQLLERRGAAPVSKHAVVDACLAEEFARLNVQSLTFGQRVWSGNSLATMGNEVIVPRTFASMAEARDSLLSLLNKCCGLYAQAYLHKKMTSIWSSSALQDLKHCLGIALKAWLETLRSSRTVIERQTGVVGPVAYRMLRLYHTYATLALAPCLHPAGEMAFDEHLDVFLSILEQTREIRQLVFSGVFNGTSHEIRQDAAPFVVDMAGIAPPYYTAVKCRIHSVRMQAIEMLEDTKKREGVWDSDVAACVARKIVTIEESSWRSTLAAEIAEPLDGICTQNQVMPRAHRLCDVRVTLPDEPGGDIGLTCSWEEGVWRTQIRKAYNQRRQTWSDLVT